MGLRNKSILAGLMVLAAAVAACAPTGTEVGFKGRVADSKGKTVPSITVAVGRKGGAAPTPVTVQTTNGQYELRVRVAGTATPTAGPQGRQLLGPASEGITIQVSAPGHKPKTFNVTASQLFISEPNALNVVLEPAA